MSSINFAKHYSLVWVWPTHSVVRSRRPPPVTSSFILLILILLGMQIRGWSHTPVSGIKTEAGHLTHQDGGKHVFYPTCLFHYQYPALGLHASWCHSDSELIILTIYPLPLDYWGYPWNIYVIPNIFMLPPLGHLWTGINEATPLQINRNL